jgi:dipeptidyl aminopeptidase/acylaminoacyl peptidase
MRAQICLRSLRRYAFLAACGPALAAAAAGSSSLPDSRRPFTVEDSIGISYLVNPVMWSVNQEPPASPIVSLDRRWFLTVSQRGILNDNRLESTIWLFDRATVAAFISGRASAPPLPRAITTFSATSNTPVISDVRWLPDSRRIAFLAKASEGYPQLYVATLAANGVEAITHPDEYVSSFDIRGDTIAYTTLDDSDDESHLNNVELTDVTGQSLWALLWRHRKLEDRSESLLLHLPNTLHILKRGRPVSLPLTLNGRPLRLYYPVMAISPDEESLVTVAAVDNVLADWAPYQPRHGYEELTLRPGNKLLFEKENDWRPSQVIVVNLHTGIATPLLSAPAGRSLFHTFGPTQFIWSPDSRQVLVSNTFLPFRLDHGSTDPLRAEAAAIAVVDVASGAFQAVTYFPQPARNSQAERHVWNCSWDQDRNEVSLAFSSRDNSPVRYSETYRLTNRTWTRVSGSESEPLPDVEITVEEDLNHPPFLSGRMPHGKQSMLVWDPNPQLKTVALGNASLHRWKDPEGNLHSGILVTPADYMPGKRYPLVLQTHGCDPNKFFADGRYTTGNGGRALAARGIVVLQMDQLEPYIDTPKEGPFQTEGFASAIRQLSREGLIDPKRVGVVGFSFTVFHVLYAITHHPGLFAAASVTDGNDLSYWLYLTWTDLPVAQKMGESANGGVKPFDRQGLLKWAELAPGFNLDKVRTPLLISCLEKGSLVASWDIYGGLRTLRKPVEMLWLRSEDAPHILVQPRQRFLSQQGCVDWFDFWLNHYEDPDPAKTAQYTRWRDLRRLQENQRAKPELPRETNLRGRLHTHQETR